MRSSRWPSGLDDPTYRVLGYRQLATIQFYTRRQPRGAREPAKGPRLPRPTAAASAELPVRMGSGIWRSCPSKCWCGCRSACSTAPRGCAIRCSPRSRVTATPRPSHRRRFASTPGRSWCSGSCRRSSATAPNLRSLLHREEGRADPPARELASRLCPRHARAGRGQYRSAPRRRSMRCGNPAATPATPSSCPISRDALLAAGRSRRRRKRRSATASPLSSNPASATGSRICIACPGRSRLRRREAGSRARRSLLQQGDRGRAKPGRAPARIARGDRSGPSYGKARERTTKIRALDRADSRPHRGRRRPRPTSATPARCCPQLT